MALAGASCTALFAVTGITNASLRAAMTGLLGGTYTRSQATYDLTRLRLKELITRIPGTFTYRLTSDGIRFAAFYTLTHRHRSGRDGRRPAPRLPGTAARPARADLKRRGLRGRGGPAARPASGLTVASRRGPPGSRQPPRRACSNLGISFTKGGHSPRVARAGVGPALGSRQSAMTCGNVEGHVLRWHADRTAGSASDRGAERARQLTCANTDAGCAKCPSSSALVPDLRYRSQNG